MKQIKSLISQLAILIHKQTSALPEEELQKFTAYFYIILTLATVCFFGLFAIGPTLDTVSNLNKQYKDNMVVYDALSQKLANLTLLDSQYQVIQGSIVNVYAAIPKTSEIPKLTRQLENIAKNNHLSIIKLTFGSIEIYPNAKDDSMYSFNFTIDVSGDGDDVQNFIRDVISFDRIVGIDRVVTGLDPENKHTTSFTGRVFFSPK